MKVYCAKIAPQVAFYKKQVDYYNKTAYEIITNELALITHNLKARKTEERYYYVSYNWFYWFSI